MIWGFVDIEKLENQISCASPPSPQEKKPPPSTHKMFMLSNEYSDNFKRKDDIWCRLHRKSPKEFIEN